MGSSNTYLVLQEDGRYSNDNSLVKRTLLPMLSRAQKIAKFWQSCGC